MKENDLTFIEQIQQPFTYWEDGYYITEVASKKEFLTGEEVHVWQAPLNSSSHFYDKLSPEEKIRAARFRLPRDQNRYINSHGILRLILAEYVGCDHSDIQLKRTKYGKPFLVSRNGKNTIRFNMTHSENVVCYIISSSNEVGIDIEYVKSDFDWFGLANVYFTSQEVIHLEAFPRDEQGKAFFTMLTRKEALLKAIGIGLSGIEEMRASESYSCIEKYPLISFEYGEYLEYYQGALAVSSGISSIRFFRVPTIY